MSDQTFNTHAPAARPSQRGNVLFLILIALVLFAALSYAITHSSRSGSSEKLSQDKAKLGAAQILQYMASIRQAVDRLKLVNHCEDEQISFYSSVWTMNNPNSPADYSCHVFHPDGGNVAPLIFNADYFEDSVYAYKKVGFDFNNRWINIGTHNNGVDSVDLIGILESVADSVCIEINRKAGINPPTYTPPTVSLWVSSVFTGSFSDSNVFNFNAPFGCIYYTGYTENIVVYPIMER